MHVELHAGARQFLAAADSLLRSDPLSANVIAVVAGRIATGSEPDSKKATAAGLSAGAERVVLYTDLANPTSTSIYQSIGYVPHYEAEEQTFSRCGTPFG